MVHWVFREKKESGYWGLLGGIGVVSLGVVGMMTIYSKPIWDSLPMIHYIQYPWRFFAFLTTLFPLLIVLCLSLLDPKKLKELFFIGVGLLIPVVIFFQYDSFRPQRYISGDDAVYITPEEVSWRVSMTSHEFIPNGVALTKDPKYGMTRLNIKEKEIMKEEYLIFNGKMNEVERMTNRSAYSVSSFVGTTIEFNAFNFPGWNVYVDSKQVYITDDNKFKLITVNVPAGEHVVELRFEDTPARRGGEWVSLITLGTLGIIGVFGMRKKTKV